jgi:predicted MFS family arabinose efflux permease
LHNQALSKESGDRPQLIAFIVAVAFFMENLDGTAIATALPQMALSFGVSPAHLSIGITAYLVTLAIFIPISGGSPIAMAHARFLERQSPSLPLHRSFAVYRPG